MLSPGHRLGPYEIVSLIGVGGMGEVYKARDPRLGRLVAVKVSKLPFSDRFKSEGRALAALNHPNICQIYDIGNDYVVLEYVEGEHLRGPLDTRTAVEVALQIADGLAAAHALGLVHRDLKPGNILLSTKKIPKILDFGLAKKITIVPDDDTLAATAENVVLGTPAYMSPEQVRGLELDGRSDQFAFGLIFYELLTGKPALGHGSWTQIASTIVDAPVGALPPTFPAQVRAVVERCVAKSPDDRYQSTRDLYLDLRYIREHLLQKPDLSATAQPNQRKRLEYAVIGAICAVGIITFALWPSGTFEPSQMTPLATEFDLQTMPRWSPAGDRIAYVAPVNGILQVFEKTVGRSTPTQVTNERESCFIPFWSSDSNRLYFITGTQSRTNLRSVALAGGPSQLVLKGVYRADLSPDGKELAALVPAGPGRYRLAFSSPPGAAPKPYGRSPLAEYSTTGIGGFLRYERSGRALGLSTITPHVSFWKIPLRDTSASEFRTENSYVVSFDWIDNGKRIVADASVSGRDDQLSIRSIDSAQRRYITTGASKQNYPAVSADGHSIAVSTGEVGFRVLKVPVDGSPPTVLTVTSRSESSPSWAPNGAQFAFATTRNGDPEIWLRNFADNTERLIVGPKELPDTAALYDCAISPNGTRIAYRQQHETGGGVIWISPLTGEPPVRLWDDPSRSPQRGPSWSPDGNWIAYYGVRNGRTALMKARVGGSSRADLLTYMDAQQSVRWSPAGDQIVFSDGATLRVVDSDGRNERVVSEHPWETYGWSTGRTLLGIYTDTKRREILAKLDVNSHRELRIADIGPESPAFELAASMNQIAYRGFSMDPNGKSFLTSALHVRTEIYLLHDFDSNWRTARELFHLPSVRPWFHNP